MSCGLRPAGGRLRRFAHARHAVARWWRDEGMPAGRIAVGRPGPVTLVVAGMLAAGTGVSGQAVRPLPGNATDASNQIGSAGINSPVPVSRFNTTNLFITGNVAGGRQFRGFSPIRDPSGLFTPMPSSHLSRFRADSMGLSDVLGGRSNYQVNPYFARSQTVTNVWAISRGLNLPGSSMPTTRYIDPNRPGTVSTWPGAVLPYAESLDAGSVTTRTDQTALPTGSSPYAAEPRSYLQRIDAPQTSALAQSPLFGTTMIGQFGIQRDSTAAGFATPFQPHLPVSAAPVAGTAAGQRVAEYLQRSRELLSPRELAPSIFGEPKDTIGSTVPFVSPTLETAVLEPSTTAVDMEAEPALPGPPEAEQPGTEAPALYDPGGRSAYEDFAGAIEWLQRLQEQAEDQPAPPMPIDAVGDFKLATEQARIMVGRTLTSYAGQTDSAVNHRIIDAEKYIREGQFYRAAGLYREAAGIDRDNPLIHIGHGHALLFAGDYVAAVYHLTRGIRRFDAIAYFKIDLAEFIPDPILLDIRRADLEKRLELQENYQLRFLLGYAEYYSGLEKFGRPNLEKAADQARQAMEEEAVTPGELPTAAVIAEFPDRLVIDESLFAPRSQSTLNE